jgi:hypothetical protein
VTAIPGHDWHDDLALQVQRGESYARLWHILASETQEWPWLKVGSKWDLERWNPVYWQTIHDVLDAAGAAGVIVEPHIFDRGCGGSQADYKNYPWHPDNNVNSLHDQLPTGGTGFPQFYEAAPGSNLYNLQAAYVRKWAEELLPYPGVILEIENEHREGGGSTWARQWAMLIRSIDPKRLISYSSLEEDLEAAYTEPAIDVVNKHFGQDGNNPLALQSYIYFHWSKGKLINIDEFANTLADKDLLLEMCETIARNGAHFHIEDSDPMADGPGAAANARQLIAAANPPFCEIGPTGPPPPCPQETKRGWSILYVNRAGQRICTGNTACTKAASDGELKPGDNIVLDSTALVGTQDPVPPGCGTCEENPTTWSHTMGGVDQADGPCGLEVWPAHSGSITACPSSGGAACVAKFIQIQ